MAVTNSTTYASTIRTKYLTKLLKVAQGYLVSDRFANNSMVGKGEGDTIRVNRILRPAKQTTVSTAGTLVTDGDAKALTSNFKEMSMEIWGDSFGWNEDIDVTSFVKNKDNRDVVGNHMARSLDYQIMKKLATECFRHRIDKDSTYIRTSAATAASTTTNLVTDGTFVTTTGDMDGGYVTVINPAGPNYDITSAITDSTSDTADTAAVVFPQACTTASNCHGTVGTGIVATDVMTTTALLDVAGRHEILETQTFGDGLFRMFIHAAQHRDLWDDTTFIDSAKYDSTSPGRMGSYRVGRWFDIEFLVSSEVYREDVDGTENQATGVCYVAPCFGKNSHSVFTFANPGGSGKFATKFYAVDEPDSKNLRLSARWLSWKGMFAAGVTRATSVIGLMTGATDMGLDVSN